MSVTEYLIIQGPDGEVLVSTHGASYRRKLGGYSLGNALVTALVVEVGTESGFTVGLSVGNGYGKPENSLMG